MLLLVLSFAPLISCTTHWKRVERSIVSQPHSPYALASPYSFVEFYEQEMEYQKALASTEELARISESVNRIEKTRKDPLADEKLLKTDACKLAATDVDLKTDTFMSEYPLELLGHYAYHGQIEMNAHSQWELEQSTSDLPDCKIHYDLPFSPYAFEHLQAMQERGSLTMSPVSPWFEKVLSEFWMKGRIQNIASDIRLRDVIGPLIRQQMVHKEPAVREMVLVHASAVSFWMMEGDAPAAMECMRTLLHSAHLHHLQHDSKINWLPFAFLQFGNLLTLASRFSDAITVLELARSMAVEPGQRALINAALGDAFALSANFTRSISFYSDSLAALIQTDHISAEQSGLSASPISVLFDRSSIAKKKAALLCNPKIREELEAQYAWMPVLLDGEEYLSRNETPDRIMSRIHSRRAPEEVHAQNELLFDQAVYGFNPYRECKLVTDKSKLTAIRCSVPNPQRYEASMTAFRKRSHDNRPSANSTILRLVELYVRDRAHAKKLSEFRNMPMDEGQIQHKFPLPDSVLEKSDFYWRRADWPSAGECNAILFHSPLSSISSVPHFFISPEEKGFILSDLLTWFIGLEFSSEHPLPWEEPFCGGRVNFTKHPLAKWEGVRELLGSQRSEEWMEEDLRFLLIRIVETKLQPADVGQRIRTLMEQNIGPQWMALNLATLYWRVHGTPSEAAICALSALSPSDSEGKEGVAVHVDVALIQLAELVLRVTGRREEAARIAALAAAAAPHQPQPRALIARIALLSSDIDVAVSHLKDALDRDPFDSVTSEDLLSVVCSGQSSKPVIRHLHPTICCSAVVQNAVCFKGKYGERCFVLEAGEKTCYSGDNQSISPVFVYNRCNGVYTGMSYKPYAITHLFSPFLPIFGTAPRKERRFVFDEAESVQTIQMTELPLDYGGYEQFASARSPDWYRMAKKTIEHDFSAEQSDDFELAVEYEQPPIPSKPLSMLWISHKSEMLKYDVPLPEVLPRPHANQIRAGLSHFPPPRVTPAMCSGVPKLESLLESVSTWASVTAKGVNIEKYIDVRSPLPKAAHRIEPDCPSPKAKISPFLTFDHLPYSPLSDQFLFYKPEKALKDPLLSMGSDKETLEGIGARLAAALRHASARGDEAELFIPAVTSALFWRVRGDAAKAVACLRLALTHAPSSMEEVALVSLANICHQAGLLHSALITAGAALPASSTLVALHFTIANIYASIGDHERALEFYYSTISLQSNLETAKERVRAIYCHNEGERYNIHRRL